MSRENYGVERGLRIYDENSDTAFIDVLSGSGAPPGTSGKTDEASVGSLYTDRSNGDLYRKIADTSSASDWDKASDISIDELNWRNEKVRFITNDTLSAGNQDITALTDNDDMVIGDINVGEYAIGDCDGSPALFEITAKPGGNDITLAVAGQAIASNDTFIVQQYLPDPTGQENAAIVHVPTAGSPCVKISDFDWALATGINLSSGYAASGGDPSAGDTVEEAIAKLDDNLDDLTSAVGVSQGDQNMGTYTGSLINDNESAKQNIQQLESEAEAIRTTQGTSVGDTNMGTYTGDYLNDNESVKQNIQQLETAAEHYPEVETGVSSATVLDSVNVDQFRSCAWLVTAFDEANPADVKSAIVHAANNGTSSADATGTDDNVSSLLVSGSFNTNISITLTGTGASQVMNLVVNTSEPNVTYTAARMACAPSGY